MTWKGCERDKIQGWLAGAGREGARHHPRVDRGTDRNPFDQVPVNILPGHGWKQLASPLFSASGLATKSHASPFIARFSPSLI